MKTHKRVTAFILDDQDTLQRQGRLVEEEDLPAIDRVFKMFNIQYEVDEIPSNSRLYSLSVTMRDSYISDNLLTQKELAEHVAPYIGKGKIISQDEFKKLLAGKTNQIYKSTPAGEVLIGYELTVKGDEQPSRFRIPLFGRKKEAKSA